MYGHHNVKLNLLKKAFPEVKITSRGNHLKISGKKKLAQTVKAKFELMVRYLRENEELPIRKVEDLLEGVNPFVSPATKADDSVEEHGSPNSNVIVYGRNGRAIKAKTRNQKKLVETVESHEAQPGQK